MRTLKGDYYKILTLQQPDGFPAWWLWSVRLYCHGPVLVVALSTLLACLYSFWGGCGIEAVFLVRVCELSSPMHRYIVWVFHSASGGELQTRLFMKLFLPSPMEDREKKSNGFINLCDFNPCAKVPGNQPTTYLQITTDHVCMCISSSSVEEQRQGNFNVLVYFFVISFSFKRTLLDCNPWSPWIVVSPFLWYRVFAAVS